LAGTALLLVNPGVAVPTPEIFRRWGGEDGGPLPSDLAAARNDLEPAAISLAPVIADVLAELSTMAGATMVRMSGSGATCFGLFECDAERDGAAARIASARPSWWQLATRLT
jgi:4-diphosphocytidyl-2-C-methyl-D-erythritol kinase